MATSKLTLSRYQLINLCLISKGKKYWSAEDLLKRLEQSDIMISKRTLEMDFAAMRDDERLGFHAPIAYCYLNRGYYYTDENYSITSLNLSEEEIDSLYIVSDLIRPYENLSVLQPFGSLINKLITHHNSSLLKPEKLIIPESLLDNSFADDVLDIVDFVLLSIRKKCVLLIKLEKLDDIETNEFLFHPYYFHEFDSEWFIIGLLDAEQKLEFVKLEDIYMIASSKKEFNSFIFGPGTQ
jgi:hypothetical protein